MAVRSRLFPLALVFAAACDNLAGPPGADGLPGATSLGATSDEPAGANCPGGGTRVDYGADDDGDGILDQPGEVDGTYYLCDGAAGATGAAGAAGTDAAATLVNTQQVLENAHGCAQGFTLVTMGADDGQGGGTAGDGVLQAGEVDSTLISCLGPDLDDDGVMNLDDNCVTSVNSFQTDLDRDGTGDACEASPIVDTVFAFTRGDSSNESDLYVLGPRYDDYRRVGPTGHALTAIKVNPDDGKLYAITDSDDYDSADDWCAGCLVQLSTTTGAASVALPIEFATDVTGYWDAMAFLSDGTLLGWSAAYPSYNTMHEIDLVTGEPTAYSGIDMIASDSAMCATDDDQLLFLTVWGGALGLSDTISKLESLASNSVGISKSASTLVYSIEPGESALSWNLLGDVGPAAALSPEAYAMRGDCDGDTEVYWGVDVPWSSSTPATLYRVQLFNDGLTTTPGGEVMLAVDSPLPNLAGLAMRR